MRTVFLTIGLPASGKSTWAKEQLLAEPKRWKRVNKDELRAMIDGEVWDRDKEKFVSQVQEAIIRRALRDGFDVIVDNTNLVARTRRRVHEVVAGIGDVKVIEKMFPVSYDKCCVRNSVREGRARVPDKAMESMYQKFKGMLKRGPQIKEVYYPPIGQGNNPEGHVRQNEDLPKAVICDLDGTLALLNGRNPFDASRCEKDLLNEPVSATIHALQSVGWKIIFVTGRESKYKEPTERWLAQYVPSIRYELYMRSTGDRRKDTILKREIYDENIRGRYYVELVLDDRPQVVRMYRHDMGFTVFALDDREF